MYQYDTLDQTIINERVAEFRDQTRRFLNGQLSEDQFRPLRLMNGLYIQRYAPMLRIDVPYGLMSSTQMRKLAQISRDYDKNYAHVTTRQNFQLNWPKLERVPDLLDELSSVQMHAIQSSGNCIRNTTSDPFAGVAEDEIEDPRIFCEIIRQWSTLHPEFMYLPRKFKIAVSGSERDRAATKVHDIGLRVVKNSQGETGFEVLVGGGLGRTPVIGQMIRPYLEKQHLLSYLEAILRVYNLYGRRDNKYKARIKILVRETGIDTFRQQVEEEWLHIKGDLLLTDAMVNRVAKRFSTPDYESNLTVDEQALETHKTEHSAFKTWMEHNTLPHKQSGYRIVIVSLKAPGIAPGDINDQQMELVADLADQYSYGELRTTHRQNLVLADVKQNDLFAVWQQLDTQQLATPNYSTTNDMICCPGLDFCSLANASSITITKQLFELLDDMDYVYDLGDIKLNMSGCMNGCGHHSVGHIGILGVDKKGEEWYQITLGGSSENDARLGDRLGPAIAKDEVVNSISTILDTYLQQRASNEESFLDTVKRTGIQPFKENVYAV
ncbi:MAG: nitrite/sulfite reductase [Gammaproteobacteria bacterium]|nr:nitrite/sulfite reductase [Gammaproteobacteria bacterium]